MTMKGFDLMITSIALTIGMFMVMFAWTVFMITVLCHVIIYLALSLLMKLTLDESDVQCCDDLCGCQCCYHENKEVNGEE